MKHRSKGVGLTFLTAMAVGLILASTALAIQFHSQSSHTFLHAVQQGSHVFTVGEGFGGVACNTVTTEATSGSATETENTAITIQAGCKDSFGRTVHINNNECKTRFHVTSKEGTSYIGNADLICPAGKDKVVTITSGGAVVCTITFQPQENMGPGRIQNEGNRIKVTLEINNLKSTTTGGFFNCGVSNGEHTEGTYTGVSPITGTDTLGNEVKIWVE